MNFQQMASQAACDSTFAISHLPQRDMVEAFEQATTLLFRMMRSEVAHNENSRAAAAVEYASWIPELRNASTTESPRTDGEAEYASWMSELRNNSTNGSQRAAGEVEYASWMPGLRHTSAMRKERA